MNDDIPEVIALMTLALIGVLILVALAQVSTETPSIRDDEIQIALRIDHRILARWGLSRPCAGPRPDPRDAR